MFAFSLTPNTRSVNMSVAMRTSVRRLRRSAVLAVGATALLAGPVARALAPAPDAAGSADLRTVGVQRYVVAPGDTLWGIARQVAPDSDPRLVVDAIARRNDLNAGELLPGQPLTIPAL